MKVLVLDDCAGNRSTLSRTLRTLGHETVKAATYDEAVLALGADLDAVISDHDLGSEKTGADFLRFARESHPHLRIVLMSGTHRSYPDLDNFLLKPFSKSSLSDALSRSPRPSLTLALVVESGRISVAEARTIGHLCAEDLRKEPSLEGHDVSVHVCASTEEIPPGATAVRLLDEVSPDSTQDRGWARIYLANLMSGALLSVMKDLVRGLFVEEEAPASSTA